MKTIENYAMKILADAGCDCYTYGGEDAKHVLSDLKEGFPDGMEYPYVDVANAILSISRARPIARDPWMVVYDGDSFTDGFGCASLDEAKDRALGILVDWAEAERMNWKTDPPTEDEIDDFDYMIYNCSVWVEKYNPDTDEYEEYWSPSYEDEKEIGWEPIRKED